MIEVQRLHVREGLLQYGKIDTLALDSICRIGGPNYATLGRVLTLHTIPQTARP